MRHNGAMSESKLTDEELRANALKEEAEWKARLLEEMHMIRRALEKIADRIGGVGSS